MVDRYVELLIARQLHLAYWTAPDRITSLSAVAGRHWGRRES